MRFDVPLIPDRSYAAFLAEHAEHLHSVHFGLYSAAAADARHALRSFEPDLLPGALAALGDTPHAIKKYVLLNSRFHHPAEYFHTEHLRSVGHTLDMLASSGMLHGIVYADLYYLNALSDALGDLAPRLEAVPSVNCMLDGPGKTLAHLAHLEKTRFAPPGKLLLDRSLNRDLDKLERTVRAVRDRYPEIKITLLANEGCLPHCPFKIAHDCHIALSHMDRAPARDAETNQTFGCIRRFFEHPELLLASPFIRPEDVDRYQGLADVLKICGRTRGPAFLQQAVRAYLARRWTGNLLELNDSTEHLAQRLCIDNHALPADFFDTVTRCDRDCTACGACAGLAERLCGVRPALR